MREISKKIVLILIAGISFFSAYSQTKAVIEIDSVSVALYEGISFPYWLKAGQKVKPGVQVSSISALEFTIDSATNALVFSQVLSITSLQTVPAKKTWKLESVAKVNFIPTVSVSPAKFSSPGTYYWNIPPGVTKICIEVWGAGGGGYYTGNNGPGNYQGGGGGGYGFQCFDVVPGKLLKVTVGSPGDGRGSNGGTSSVDSIISATGGQDGDPNKQVNGGGSTAKFNVSGGKSGGISGSDGGYGALGGAGGVYGTCGNVGGFPGGGGSAYDGRGYCRGPVLASGASGQVIIHW